MKQQLKNLIVITLIISILVLFIPNYTRATTSMDELRRMYPNGYQWNDDYYGSTSCHGFACLVYDKYYGINPIMHAEKCYDLNQIDKGDIVRYNGHTVFILSRSGESTTVVECNYDWQNHVRWDQPKSFNEFRNNFEYIFKAPYPLGSSPKAPEAPTNVSVDTSNGVKVSWNKGNNCMGGYIVRIYNQSTGAMEKEITIGKATTLSISVFGLKTATYSVRVYGVGFNNALSSNYGEATFSCKEEAKYCTVSPEKKTIAVGESFQFSIALSPSNGIADIKFYAGEGTDQNIIQIDKDGTITGLKEGLTKVWFEFKTSQTRLVRSFPIKVVKPVKLQETEKRMKVGQVSKLNIFSSASDGKITWSTSNKKIATVDESGNVTALTAGTVTIKARQMVYHDSSMIYSQSSETTDTCTITIVDPNVYAESISLDKKSITIENIGEKALLTATITPNNTTDKTVTWKSNNERIATVDEKGYVTAKGEGTTTIIAKTSNGKSAQCTVTVPKQIKCNLNYNVYTFKSLSEKLQLQASLTSGYRSSFTYKSTNEKVLKVDKSGNVTPVKGGFAKIEVKDNKYGKIAICNCYVQVPVTLSDGSKAYIGDMNKDGLFNSSDSAMILDVFKGIGSEDSLLLGDVNGDGFVNSSDASFILDVYKNDTFCPGSYYHITKVTLDKTNLTLYIGTPQTLKATINPDNTTDSTKLTWSSNSDSIVKVDENGKLTPVKKGKATITVKTSNGKTATCTVSVEDKKLIKGDANGDGKISTLDYGMILSHVKKTHLLKGEELKNADVNGDGKVSTLDYGLVLSHVKKTATLF